MATNLYPEISIDHSKTPNRWYAIPVLGFLYKLIITIPVQIEISILRFCVFLLSILNALNIFFRGRYWKLAYQLNVGTIQLETNVSYFLYGLTDKYPGFSLATTVYSLNFVFPKKPNRLFAFPILGAVARFILMIPYLIYSHIIDMASFLAIFVSWIPVLFKGRYPETTFEISRDSVRINQAVNAYFLGLSDEYPSWWISMSHKPLKILLLALAVILSLWGLFGQLTPNVTNPKPQPKAQYQQISQPHTNSYY